MRPLEGKMPGTPSPDPISTRRQRIATLARQAPQTALTTLAHHLDIDWMYEAYRRTRKDGAVGVDGQTAESYAADLEANLRSLLDRAKSGRYQAPPVRRVHIPKGTGSETRPIGIPICRSYCTSSQGGLGISGGRNSAPRRFPIGQVPDRLDHRRRTGRRNSAMTSGVRRIHRGPWGTAWTASRWPS